jgi:hypothetical protein
MFQGSQITRTKAKLDCRFIIYGFTSRSRIHLLSIAGEGLQNSALKVSKQGGIFIMPNLRFSGLIRRTAPFYRILRHTRVCGGSFLTRILCQYIEYFGTQDKFELRQSLIIYGFTSRS